VRFDYLAFPVWGWGTVPGREGGREVVGMVRPEALALPADLEAELWDWSRWADAHSDHGGGQPATPADRSAWWERGRDLAGRLAAATGAAVVFGHPTEPDCPTCRP
jgi:hypothetical protein